MNIATESDSSANMSSQAHSRRVLAAADFLADYRASHPGLLRAPTPPSDSLNQNEMDALLAALVVP